MYNGKAAEVVPYFKKLGYPCPSGINAGEFAVDLISKSYDSAALNQETEERIISLAAHALAVQPKVEDSAISPQSEERPVRRRRFQSSPFTQFVLLFRRAWREVARSKGTIAIKAAQQVGPAVVEACWANRLLSVTHHFLSR